eukprot:jgi/Mesvir1/26314/Mv22496-RA.4
MGKFRFSTYRVNPSVAMPAFEDCGTARRLRRIPLQNLARSLQGPGCVCCFHPSCNGFTGNLITSPFLRRRLDPGDASTSAELETGVQPLLSFMILAGLINKPCWYNRLPDLRRASQKFEAPGAREILSGEPSLEVRSSQAICETQVSPEGISPAAHGAEQAGISLSQIEAACLIRRIIDGTASPSVSKHSGALDPLQAAPQEECTTAGCPTSACSWSFMTVQSTGKPLDDDPATHIEVMLQDLSSSHVSCGAPAPCPTSGATPLPLCDATRQVPCETRDAMSAPSPDVPQPLAIPRTPRASYSKTSFASPAAASCWSACSPSGSYSNGATRSLMEAMWSDADVGVSAGPTSSHHDCSACGCHLEALRMAAELPPDRTPVMEAAAPAGVPPALLVAQLLTLKERLEACLSSELEPLVAALETVLRKARAVERIERVSLRNGAMGADKTRASVNMSMRPELEAVFKQAAGVVPQLRAIVEQGLREPLASATQGIALNGALGPSPVSARPVWASASPGDRTDANGRRAGTWLGGSSDPGADGRSDADASVARTLATSSPPGMWICPFMATPEGRGLGSTAACAGQEDKGGPCVPGGLSSPASLVSSSLSSSLVITPLIGNAAYSSHDAASPDDGVGDDAAAMLAGVDGAIPRSNVLAQGLLCLGCGSRSYAGLGTRERRTAALASTLTDELIEEFESTTGRFSAQIEGLQHGTALLQQRLDTARSDADGLRDALLAEQRRHVGEVLRMMGHVAQWWATLHSPRGCIVRRSNQRGSNHAHVNSRQ